MQSKRSTQIKGALLLLLAAFIWGTSFVAQSIGMEQIEAFTFNGIRTLMGAGVLFVFILIRDTIQGKSLTPEEIAERSRGNRLAVRYGFFLGLVLCLASNLQQFAFNYSSAGKIAFITAFYMFFVPMLGLFIGKRIPWLTWVCVAVGFVGLYLLTIVPGESFTVNRGDFLSFLCAIVFAVHILLVEKFAQDVDGIKLSCMQFLTSGTISVILMFLFESPDPSAIRAVLPSLLYSGVMSCGIAYTLQIVGQKYAEATVASLTMCMESVFGVLSAAVILGDRLTLRESIGCILMFAAIILSQLADGITERIRKKRKGETQLF